MSTLTEIEAAAEALPPKQLEALLRFLTERLQQRASEDAGRHSLAEFSGKIHLREEPLTWQSTMRNEWS
jgi:hypothetical protein